jgi:hypothetical protein
MREININEKDLPYTMRINLEGGILMLETFLYEKVFFVHYGVKKKLLCFFNLQKLVMFWFLDVGPGKKQRWSPSSLPRTIINTC